MIEIQTNGKDIVAELARFDQAQMMRALNAAVGKRVEVEHRRFFAAKPSNRRGWPSQNFWRRRIRNATSLTSYNAEGSTITIADSAMNQKVYGGPIRPREGKMLTIPARPEANGRSPRTFSNLVFIPLRDFRQGRGAGKLVGLLVEKSDSGRLMRSRGRSRSGQKTRLKVFYYCVAGVYQAPDRTALPEKVAVHTWITDEVGRFFTRQLRRGGSR